MGELDTLMRLADEYAGSEEDSLSPRRLKLEKSLRAALAARQDVPEGWKLVPLEATRSMMAAAVIYANGNAVYKNVAAPVLEIEERIYGEVYEAMIENSPAHPAQPVPQAVSQGNETGGKL